MSQTAEQNKYNVVFEYTAATGGYCGVRTFTTFRDEAHFKEIYTPDVQAREIAIAKGISTKDAVALCEKTPLDALVASARQDATYKNGKFDKRIFQLEMNTILLSREITPERREE